MLRSQKYEEFIKRIIQDCCELPDRSSPEDEPDMLLVRVDELSTIIEQALEHYSDD